MIYILCILLIIVISIYFVIRNKIRQFSRQIYHTDSLLDGIKKQEEDYANTPKSVSRITRIALPKINKDFPEFDWNDWKYRCETALVSYLETLESKDITKLKNCSDDFKNHVYLIIQDYLENHVQEKYDAIKIHQTEIKKYQKNNNHCCIIVESAVEYLYSNNELKNKKQQERYDIELVYIQDASLIDHHSSSIALTCPHCGAPVTKLGQKQCEYCDNILIPLNIKVWSLSSIYKV